MSGNSEISTSQSSSFLKKVREAAERSSGKNAQAMSHEWVQRASLLSDQVLSDGSTHKQRFLHDVASKVSGRSSVDTQMRVGTTLGVGGISSLMGIAMANMSASAIAAGVPATAVSSALASLSAAMATLGTVAVGASAIPLAPAVALGTAAVGAAVLVATCFRSTDHLRENRTWNALNDLDSERLTKAINTGPTVKDWIAGAGEAVAGVIGRMFTKGEQSPSAPVDANTVLDRISENLRDQIQQASIDAAYQREKM